jgi:hypothetical protein
MQRALCLLILNHPIRFLSLTQIFLSVFSLQQVIFTWVHGRCVLVITKKIFWLQGSDW